MTRLLCAVLAGSLWGTSAAFAVTDADRAPGSSSIGRLVDLAGKSLLAIDGSTIALASADGGLAREITVPDGRAKTTFFVPLNDSLGTVSESRAGGGRSVAGIFRITDTGIAAAYADGRSEVLTLNGSGGVSMVMHATTGDVSCMGWYPAGHRFSVAERKAAVAEYARRLGIAQPRPVTRVCAAAAEKIAEAPPMTQRAAAASGIPTVKGSGILGRIVARAMDFYARIPAVPSADVAAADQRLDLASNSEVGFENFYANFLSAHEGGYTGNDGNGSPANFGINQGANPDIDVLNLTQADAKQILHDRYWVASGADRLPAALAAVHGDTAINMGVGAANDLLAQSGGDPQTYLDLRDARYRAIAANSDRARYLPVWLGRNEDLRNFAGGDGLAGPQQSHAALSAFSDATGRQ